MASSRAGAAAATETGGQARSTAEHLEDALRTLHDTEEIAATTSETLAGDREKIERVHRTTEAINSELDRSNHLLRGMASWFGNVFRRSPKAAAPPATPEPKASARGSGSTARAAAGAPPARSPVERGPTVATREDELLAGLSEAVGRLHESAAASGSKIDHQTRMLDDYASQADKTRARVEAATRKARDLAS